MGPKLIFVGPNCTSCIRCTEGRNSRKCHLQYWRAWSIPNSAPKIYPSRAELLDKRRLATIGRLSHKKIQLLPNHMHYFNHPNYWLFCYICSVENTTTAKTCFHDVTRNLTMFCWHYYCNIIFARSEKKLRKSTSSTVPSYRWFNICVHEIAMGCVLCSSTFSNCM